MSIHGRRESLERTVTEVVTTASQVFISVVWILRWVYIYYSNDISYKTNTTWIFSIFSIFSCKKTFILYFSLETFNFSEIIAHRKILHRNPSLQKKKYGLNSHFTLFLQKICCCFPDGEHIPVSPTLIKSIWFFVLTLHIYMHKMIYSFRFNIFMYYIHEVVKLWNNS